MVRSLFVFSLIFVASVGCSPEAAKQMTDKAVSGVSEATGKATEAISGTEGVGDMVKQASELFSGVTQTLGGIKDADSATAALPELGKLTEGFGGMSDMFAKMPEVGKSAFAGVFQSSLDQLKPIIEKVMAIPGVEAVLKPAIDALMAKLDSFK